VRARACVRRGARCAVCGARVSALSACGAMADIVRVLNYDDDFERARRWSREGACALSTRLDVATYNSLELARTRER